MSNILFQGKQRKLWGACLFVTVTDMDMACFTFTQVLKAVSVKYVHSLQYMMQVMVKYFLSYYRVLM